MAKQKKSSKEAVNDMNSLVLKTPVLFIIFNRPDTTRQVFNRIKQAKPQQLFIAADGPRPHVPGELEKCRQTRDIIKEIDWECEVKNLFREENLGCKKAVSSAIDWFFANVEEGMILEDDCVPDISFFYYCQELLERYRDSDQIMHIGGSNFQFGKKWGKGSYYFSRFINIWGWATWRRAWHHYDVEMKKFPEFKQQNKMDKICGDARAGDYLLRTFERTYKGEIDTWDYQWLFSVWMQDGYGIIPNVNLISNIGFRHDGTHTKKEGLLSDLKTIPVNKIVHPSEIIVSNNADIKSFTIYSLNFVEKIKYKILKFFFFRSQ